MTFYYSMSFDAGKLSVIQDMGMGRDVDQMVTTWTRTGAQHDGWQYGYAEMFATAFDFQAVFQAQRGVCLSIFILLLFDIVF